MQKTDNLPDGSFFDFDIYTGVNDAEMPLCEEIKSIAVLVCNASESDLVFLSKILAAVKLDFDKDILLINSSSLPVFNQFRALPSIDKLLVFGILPADIGLHIMAKPYNLINFNNYSLLFVHALKDISEDVNKKKLLWQQLQVLF
jgi:hypothetical protein